MILNSILTMPSGMPDCLANLAISSSLSLVLAAGGMLRAAEFCGFGEVCAGKPFGEAFGDNEGGERGGGCAGLVLGSVLGWVLRLLSIASTIVPFWLQVYRFCTLAYHLQRYEKCVKCQMFLGQIVG